MNKAQFTYLLACSLLTLLVSCSYFQKKDERKPVARVNKNYLYADELAENIPKKASLEDSAIIANNYITHWATEQLFLDQAKLNLPIKQQEDFEELVKGYRKELYTEAYKDIIVARKLDTALSKSEIEAYYEANKLNFRLNQDLVKLRYIHLTEKFPKRNEIKEQVTRFNDDDKVELNKESLKFLGSALNDSVWVSARSIYKEIPPLTPADKDQFLKKGNFMQLQDSLGVYLVHINDVLLRNDQAPLTYVKPTIKQILLNKRKLELSKKLEKDITKDAIKNEKFEIYN